MQFHQIKTNKLMAEHSVYCKAYYLKKLRQFTHWKEDLSNLRQVEKEVDGKKTMARRETLSDEDFLYLHDNFVVADGIFKDENIVFNNITDEWKSFCTTVLEFRIPAEVLENAPA